MLFQFNTHLRHSAASLDIALLFSLEVLASSLKIQSNFYRTPNSNILISSKADRNNRMTVVQNTRCDKNETGLLL